jgi:hypothetical protein
MDMDQEVDIIMKEVSGCKEYRWGRERHGRNGEGQEK